MVGCCSVGCDPYHACLQLLRVVVLVQALSPQERRQPLASGVQAGPVDEETSSMSTSGEDDEPDTEQPDPAELMLAAVRRRLRELIKP
jgi:hypothetical protein